MALNYGTDPNYTYTMPDGTKTGSIPFMNPYGGAGSVQGLPGTQQLQPLSTAPKPAAPAPAPAPTSSPVQANGKIAPATGAPTAAPTPAQQQYPTMQGGTQFTSGTSAPQPGPYPYSSYPTVNPASAESQQYSNLMQLLMNPQSMPPELVAQMKGANRDEAAMLQKQMLDQIHASTASRGLQVGGGWDAMQSRNAGEAAIQQILSGNRGIDIQAAQQNHQDLLNALQQGDASLGGAENRNLSAAQLALQRMLGIGGLNMDQSRLSEQGREFNLGNQLNWAQLMNNMVMGRAGYGLNLAQLQQQAQQGMGSFLGF